MADPKRDRPNLTGSRARQDPTRYFLGITSTLLVTSAVVIAGLFAWMRLSAGPCDALLGRAVSGLEAEIRFFEDVRSEFGISPTNIQELEGNTQVAGLSLRRCCTLRMAEELSEQAYLECERHGGTMAQLPTQLAAVHEQPARAEAAIASAAKQLESIAGNLRQLTRGRNPLRLVDSTPEAPAVSAEPPPRAAIVPVDRP